MPGTMTITQYASTVASYLERVPRPTDSPNVETFVRLTEAAPDWLRDAVRDAHGEMLHDDYVFEYAAAAVDYVSDAASPDADADTIRGLGHDFADNVDVYHDDLFAWVASTLYRVGMVDDAREEYGSDDQGLMGLIALGQYAERHVVYSIVIDALLDAYEEQAGTDAEGDS